MEIYDLRPARWCRNYLICTELQGLQYHSLEFGRVDAASQPRTTWLELRNTIYSSEARLISAGNFRTNCEQPELYSSIFWPISSAQK